MPTMSKEIPGALENYFFGNWKIFCEAIKNPETLFVYDIDGILIDSARTVFNDFIQKTGVFADPAEVDRFDYLTHLARLKNLSDEQIATADDGWYDPKVLMAARKYLYIKPVVDKTINLYGPAHNFVLTSRNPDLTEATLYSMRTQFPEIIAENILIRSDHGDTKIFKAENLKILAKTAPWVVFVDDSTDFAKAALGNGTKNCIVVNIPQGKMVPGFEHERLVYLKRFPVRLQAMWPFMRTVQIALGEI